MAEAGADGYRGVIKEQRTSFWIFNYIIVMIELIGLHEELD